MEMFQSIILGLVQGLTEFLPVSSSGHLIMLQRLWGIEASVFYDVMLHVGTLVAVVIVLWPEIVAIITHPIKNKLGMLILATVPAVVVTIVAEKVFPEVFENVLSGEYLAYGFFATTGVLVLCELIARRREKQKHIELPQALSMGLMQAAALVPGLSRSGSTIAGGLFAGVNREKAAKFAFLMSIPAIAGGVIFGANDAIETGLGDASVAGILVGMAVAAVSGYFAIRFMLRLISKHKLYGFAVYTAAMGAVVLLTGI